MVSCTDKNYGKVLATNAPPMQICPEFLPWQLQQYCRKGTDYRHPWVKQIHRMEQRGTKFWKLELANMFPLNTFFVTQSELETMFPSTWQILQMIATK